MKTVLILLCLVWAITGCATQSSSTQPATYVLNAEVAPAQVAQSSGKVLLVATPRAEPGFDSARIAYTDTPLALSYYSQSQWADAPARMLTPLLVNTLEKTAAFRAVVMSPTPVSADLRLDVILVRLQQEFSGQDNRVRFTLRVSLTEFTSTQVIATRLFEVEETAPSNDAYGGVQAANSALAQLLEQIAGFVVKWSL